MIQLKKEEMERIAPLFAGWDETLIWSCLQGIMGRAWADSAENPQSAQILIGDFCFFAGIPDQQLIENIPETFPSPMILMIPLTLAWENLIEQIYPLTSTRFKRYALKKEPGVFDKERLAEIVQQLPESFQIVPIDEECYHRVLQESWSKDFCSQFPDYESYQRDGLGFVVLCDGRIVSGASSYIVYDKGIEIEIGTCKDFRRRGIAKSCAAKLILECLARDLYPSWDAANMASVHLAQQLGYHFDREYVAYAVKCKRPLSQTAE